MESQFRLGVDVGGTFTDAVLIGQDTGDIFISKVPSTPSDPSIGVLAAIDKLLQKSCLPARGISVLIHGSTVATNALIEGKVPKTAFVTTMGFRDLLEIGRQIRPSLYDIDFQKPRRLVPRNLCYEIPERLDAAGHILQPLDEARAREVAGLLKDEGIQSVAICFLHSYLNPIHEEQVLELLREQNPEVSFSISTRVVREFREYMRASTTVVNACVRPVVSRYIGGIRSRLAARGLSPEILIMQSNGGVMTCDQASERPVFMVESGPAAGVMAARFVSEALQRPDVISFDMGGTTAKAGLILGGQPRTTKDYEVGAQACAGVGQARGSGYPIQTPVIDLVEIGAGGGSIAWVDIQHILRVGPQSAGAEPGPICYGRGGENPTVTDANLVLGRINPQYFLGGDLQLNVAAAVAGIRKKCAEPLGLDVVEAAYGIVEIANANMAKTLRLITVGRGYNPSDLAMVAFGGAGPLHANQLCREMGIPFLVIPPSPGTTSALGLLVTDLKYLFSRTHIMKMDGLRIDVINRAFTEMEAEGQSLLADAGVGSGDISFLRQIEMRYVGQSYEIAIGCPGGSLASDDMQRAFNSFHIEHERAYGRFDVGEPVELVNFCVTAIGTIPKPRLREVHGTDHGIEAARKGSRSVFFSEAKGFTDTLIYDRSRLSAGCRFTGPAIVEEVDSSSVIHPGFEAQVDICGNLIVTPVRPDRLTNATREVHEAYGVDRGAKAKFVSER
jgi:N-methylhydantoinase A